MTVMRKSKYSEAQIIGFIKQVEAGMSLMGKNATLKRPLAEAHLDIHALKTVLGGK